MYRNKAKVLLVAAVVTTTVAVGTVASGLFADSAEARRLNISRAQMRADCERNGVIGYGYYRDTSANYGCIKNDGWIVCDAREVCKRGRATASRRADNAE